MKKNDYRNIYLVFFSIIIAGILLELILRFFGLGYNLNPSDWDNIRHHSNPKNFMFRSYDSQNEFGGHYIFYDAKGYRVPNKEFNIEEQKGVKRIAFIGDSMTQAVQHFWKDSFIGIIQERFPNIVVRNFGTGSYSPLLYLVLLKRDVKEFKPTDVIIQLYANDMGNDEYYYKFANSKNINEINSVSSRKNWIIKYYRYSYLLRFLRKVQQNIKVKYYVPMLETLFPKTPDEKRAKFFDSNAGWNELGNENNLTTKLLNEIIKLSEESKYNLYFFFIPWKKRLTSINSCCESDTHYRQVRKFITNNNFIDISNYMKNSKESLFFEHWPYPNQNGHRAIANAISDVIKN